MYEIKVDPTVVEMEPKEAFMWLFSKFREYSHGKIIWIDVKSIFATADAVVARWAEQENPEPVPLENLEAPEQA